MDKTVLLYGEQGLGDIIQFSRYAKLVSNLGAKVILEIPKSLSLLMKNLEGVSQLVVQGQQIPSFDFHCPLLSLPLAFQTNLSNIPHENSYISLDDMADRAMKWEEKLGPRTLPRIGLVWSGNSKHKNDQNRSILLKNILPYLPKKYAYVSLQKEVRDVDLSALEFNPHIISFADHLNDFVDTAALINCLDMVLSVDTSIAHLSGALGKKTLVLLPCVPDWRWLLNRTNSPWYPTVKLYRQTVMGDWNAVFDKVKSDLNRGDAFSVDINWID